MSNQKELHRNVGHPWDGRPGFDLLGITADTQGELDQLIDEAKLKFWQVWISGFDSRTNNPAAALYKPCGISMPWDDSFEKPHPGNQCDEVDILDEIDKQMEHRS